MSNHQTCQKYGVIKPLTERAKRIYEPKSMNKKICPTEKRQAQGQRSTSE